MPQAFVNRIHQRVTLQHSKRSLKPCIGFDWLGMHGDTQRNAIVYIVNIQPSLKPVRYRDVRPKLEKLVTPQRNSPLKAKVLVHPYRIDDEFRLSFFPVPLFEHVRRFFARETFTRFNLRVDFLEMSRTSSGPENEMVVKDLTHQIVSTD